MLVLVLAGVGQAQSLLQTFGSGANQFTMEFVTIGNPGNAADTTGIPNSVGSVSYAYNLGKYEVSRDMITRASAAGSLGLGLADMTNYGGNGGNRPATGVSWYAAAKFVNWLNTSTGGTAAYKFSGDTFQLWSAGDAGYNANNLFRNSLAKYWIASADEWYKGAYYDPNKSGGAGYWNFATQGDSAPTSVTSGTTANTAVYNHSLSTGPADITNAGGLSAYGTMAQGGNVWEWTETASDGINNVTNENRDIRGGFWNNSSYYLNAGGGTPMSNSPGDQTSFLLGFRVASVPEPSALSLLVVGLSGLAIMHRRKTK